MADPGNPKSEAKPYSVLDAARSAGRFLGFMAIAAGTLVASEAIIKALFFCLEWLHGESFPTIIKHLITWIVDGLALTFVIVYAVLHIHDLWKNLKRGLTETEDKEEAVISDTES